MPQIECKSLSINKTLTLYRGLSFTQQQFSEGLIFWKIRFLTYIFVVVQLKYSYNINVNTKKVQKILNKAKTLQNITFFSEKVWQKLHKLRDRNVKNHWVNCAAKMESHWVNATIFQGWQVIWKINVWQLCVVKLGCESFTETDPSFFMLL